jgi:mono/diheme cytochrome c family protein
MYLRMLTVLSLLCCASFMAGAQEADDGVGISGEHDFGIYCASCHGEDGRGGGPSSFGLSTEPPDLTTLARRHGGAFPESRVARLIDGREEVKAHGPREMPVWGDWFKMEAAEGLGGAEGGDATVRRRIANLIEFLKSIQQ